MAKNKKQTHWYQKWWVWLIIFLILLGAADNSDEVEELENEIRSLERELRSCENDRSEAVREYNDLVRALT